LWNFEVAGMTHEVACCGGFAGRAPFYLVRSQEARAGLKSSLER
jgi:hypothetical protein